MSAIRLRLLSALLAAAMLFAMVPVRAFAADSNTVPGQASYVNGIQFRDETGKYGFVADGQSSNKYTSDGSVYELSASSDSSIPTLSIKMASASAPIRFTGADVECNVTVSTGKLIFGKFNGGVSISNGSSSISGGEYYGWIFNNGGITGGTFHLSSARCVPSGKISSSTTEKVSFFNQNTVQHASVIFEDSSATFYNQYHLMEGVKFDSAPGVVPSPSAVINASRCNIYADGEYSVPIRNEGTIEGAYKNNPVDGSAIFNAAVTNTGTGTISAGVFNGNVANSGTISAGVFNGGVANSGRIENGTFTGSVVNADSGTISGGFFKEKPAAATANTYLVRAVADDVSFGAGIFKEAYVVGNFAMVPVTSSATNISTWSADNSGAHVINPDTHSMTVILAKMADGTVVTIGPAFTVSIDGRELNGNEVNLPYNENGYTAAAMSESIDEAGTITPRYYPVKEDGTLDPALPAGTIPTAPGKYKVTLAIAGGTTYKEQEVTSNNWFFTIEKKTLSADDFHFDPDTKKVSSDQRGMGAVSKVTVKDSSGNETEITNGDTSSLSPSDYTITKVTVADGKEYSAGTVDIPSEKNWSFAIKAPTPAAPKHPLFVDGVESIIDGDGNPLTNNDEVAEDTLVKIEAPATDASGMVFDRWVIEEPDGLELTGGFDAKSSKTQFIMPPLKDGQKLTLRAQYVTPDQSGQSDDFISTAAAVAGGAVLTGLVAWNGYNIFAEVYMKQFLPVLPENRQQLALALWNEADRPAPAEDALYTDVDAEDADTQAAARWAVENGLLKPADKNDENVFKSYKSVSVGQVYRTWKKVQEMTAR